MYFKVSRQMCRHTDNLQCCMFMFSIKYLLLKIVSIEIINVFDLKCKLTIDNRSRNVRSLHSAECCRTNFGPAPSHSLVNIFPLATFLNCHLPQNSHVGKIVIHLVSWKMEKLENIYLIILSMMFEKQL